MKLFVLIALLISGECYAAQRLSSKVLSYFPTFSYGSTSSVAYTGAQGSIATLAPGGAGTELIRILTTTAAYIDIGLAPSASSAKMPIAANTETIIEVVSGHFIGAIKQAGASDGTLYITRLPIIKD